VIVAGESGFYTNGAAYSGRVRIYNMPSTIKSIWGSNDDVNWTKITTAPTREEATSNVAGLAFGYDDRLEFKNLDNPNYYKYHAIVADAFTRLKDVKLFGVRNQGSSTLHDGALTLTKNLDVPRIGPPLDADDTPRRDRLVVEYNTSTNPTFDGAVRDTSGRGNDGVFVGTASYEPLDKALTFPGTEGNYLTTGGLNAFVGDQPYTVSGWFKRTSTSTSRQDWFYFGLAGTAYGSGFSIFTTGNATYAYGYGNDIYTSINQIPDQSWYHLAITFVGGIPNTKNKKVYLNGGDITSAFSDGTAGYTQNFQPNSPLVLGGGASGAVPATVNISNFKLYDCTLTAEEVKTLYDMGRCDEGGHVVNFSKTRVGIGLGDGEVPRGALDVRGVANFGSRVGIGIENVNPQRPLHVSGDSWVTGVMYDGYISSDRARSVKKYVNGINLATLTTSFKLGSVYRGGIIKLYMTSGVSGANTTATVMYGVWGFNWGGGTSHTTYNMAYYESQSGNATNISVASDGVLTISGSMYSSFSYPLMEVEVYYAGGIFVDY
jgi:hypothetical protein